MLLAALQRGHWEVVVPPVVQVQYNPDITGPRHLIAAVEDAGFDAEAISIDRWAQLLSASCTAFHTFHRDTSWLQQSLVLAALGPLLMAQP